MHTSRIKINLHKLNTYPNMRVMRVITESMKDLDPWDMQVLLLCELCNPPVLWMVLPARPQVKDTKPEASFGGRMRERASGISGN